MERKNNTLRMDYQNSLIEIMNNELVEKSNPINVNDNFFDVGMNSVSLVRSLNTFNEEYGLEIEITTLFEFTTIKEFLDSILVSNKTGNQDEDDDENYSSGMDTFLEDMKDLNFKH